VDLISSWSGPLQWTGGIAELNYHQPFTLQSTNYNDAAVGEPQLQPDYNSGLILSFHTYRKNYAAFSELSYDIDPQWQIKVGGRFNHDGVGLQSGSYIIPPSFPPCPTGGPSCPVHVSAGPNEQTYTAGTGRVLVNYLPSNDELIYASVSRGYKPGGWTPNVGDPVPTPDNVYGPEFVLNYELGWKATLLDKHLKTSVDAFDMDYKGFQATVATDPTNPTTSVTRNVQGTRIWGFEAQGEALFGGFDFSLGGTYLHAIYGNLAIFAPAGTYAANDPRCSAYVGVPCPINLNGEQVDYAPKLSGNVAVAYTLTLPRDSTLTPRVQWTYQGSQFTGFFDAPEQYVPAYGLGSVRLTYIPKSKWRLELFGSNITNRLYLTTSNGATPTSAQGIFGAPRQYGGTVQFDF
jgi:iron complex outermembrane receptor protein